VRPKLPGLAAAGPSATHAG